MDDRELLEMAAKAAGMEIHWPRQNERDEDGYGNVGLWIINGSTCWNPITDDGDALRLAVMLKLDVIHDLNDDDTWVMAGRLDCVEDVADESLRAAATRRAIVRAAAEIGAAMKENNYGECVGKSSLPSA